MIRQELMNIGPDTVVRLRCGAVAKINTIHSWYDGYCPADVEILEGLHLLPKELQEAVAFWKHLRIDCGADRGGKTDIVEVVKQMNLFGGAA